MTAKKKVSTKKAAKPEPELIIPPINKRIGDILFVEKNFNTYQVSRALKASPQNVTNWFKGNSFGKITTLSAQSLALICELYKICPEYALFGTGDKYLGEVSDTKLEANNNNTDVLNTEIQHLKEIVDIRTQENTFLKELLTKERV